MEKKEHHGEKCEHVKRKNKNTERYIKTGESLWSSSDEINGANKNFGSKDKKWKNCVFKKGGEISYVINII